MAASEMGDGPRDDRSRLMARIRGRNTKPEVQLRAGLRKAGLRGRANPRCLGTTPDIGLAGRFCIFIDGCFWHGCPSHYVRPRRNGSFWSEKLFANVSRDIRQTRALRSAGWRVMRFWEHEIEEDPARCVEKVIKALVKTRIQAVSSYRVALAVPVDALGLTEYRLLLDLQGRSEPRLVEVARQTGKWKRRK